jgi:cyclophilin family peptidyl-prolyl cis-trans isomerase
MNRAPIKNESANGLGNLRGTIAMARTGDPHSATSQFFINHITNQALNRGERDEWGYCVFGKVTDGLAVLDAIAEVPTGDKNEHRNVPKEPVLIKSVKRATPSAS